jgi:hypothetical protein
LSPNEADLVAGLELSLWILTHSQVKQYKQSKTGHFANAMTGAVAYKHTGKELQHTINFSCTSDFYFVGENVTIVTAAVDRISLLHTPKAFCDMDLQGMVTWTSGRSSMEVSLEVVTKDDNEKIMTCQFTMVALDPQTKKYAHSSVLQQERMKLTVARAGQRR